MAIHSPSPLARGFFLGSCQFQRLGEALNTGILFRSRACGKPSGL